MLSVGSDVKPLQRGVVMGIGTKLSSYQCPFCSLVDLYKHNMYHAVKDRAILDPIRLSSTKDENGKFIINLEVFKVLVSILDFKLSTQDKEDPLLAKLIKKLIKKLNKVIRRICSAHR